MPAYAGIQNLDSGAVGKTSQTFAGLSTQGGIEMTLIRNHLKND